jgi:hypothetical protein
MQINAELTQAEADKIAFIQQQTQQNIAEVLKSAIDLYYRNLHDHPKSPLQILEETGFIGCCSVESDLSTTYKTVLAEGLAQKYDYR